MFTLTAQQCCSVPAVMRNFVRYLALSLALCLPVANSWADDEPWTLNIYFENDLFGETDQNYTNGVRMSWVSPDTASYYDDPEFPAWVRAVNRKLRFFNGDGENLEHNLVISLGQLMYTPSDIQATELVADERPYAGYLYAGFAYHTRSEDQLDTVEINLGVVGPAAQGEEAQDFIHDLRGFDKFQGWDNQLKNEPAVTLLYEHKRRLFRSPFLEDGRFQHDFIGHSGISLGNVATYVNFGGEYRIGWDLPNDFGTSAVRSGGDNSAPGRGDIRRHSRSAAIYGLHGFISVDARLVAQDIFLDGNSFRDSHGVNKEKEVADVSSGISFLTGRWKMSFAWVIRTREFKEQPHHHKYGSFSVSYTL
ncbi:MAG: lipid A deacylase LpxR family protein [Porticoccaceae bacterium]|nr:lipid A deacylase LpxR family protein [Porticoccaceae bacterium]